MCKTPKPPPVVAPPVLPEAPTRANAGVQSASESTRRRSKKARGTVLTGNFGATGAASTGKTQLGA